MFDLVNILSGKLLHISAGRISVWFPIRELHPVKWAFPFNVVTQQGNHNSLLDVNIK